MWRLVWGHDQDAARPPADTRACWDLPHWTQLRCFCSLVFMCSVFLIRTAGITCSHMPVGSDVTLLLACCFSCRSTIRMWGWCLWTTAQTQSEAYIWTVHLIKPIVLILHLAAVLFCCSSNRAVQFKRLCSDWDEGKQSCQLWGSWPSSLSLVSSFSKLVLIKTLNLDLKVSEWGCCWFGFTSCVFLVSSAGVSGGQTSDCSYLTLLKHLNLTATNDVLAIMRPVRNWTTSTVVLVDMVLFGILEVVSVFVVHHSHVCVFLKGQFTQNMENRFLHLIQWWKWTTNIYSTCVFSVFYSVFYYLHFRGKYCTFYSSKHTLSCHFIRYT